jgi:signal recognition particle subunit SRP54
MAAVKKRGSLKSMLKMMPGMGQMAAQIDAFDEREFDRVEAMVRSMTPFERNHPKQINGSRRARIAKGSGVTVSEVNALLERFGEAQKMMKSLARGGGIPGMPGMPGMGGGGGKRAKGRQQPQRRKAKSGNPAKRAAEERAARERSAGAGALGAGALGGSAFGGGQDAPDLSALDPAQLPAGFEKFLGGGKG